MEQSPHFGRIPIPSCNQSTDLGSLNYRHEFCQILLAPSSPVGSADPIESYSCDLDHQVHSSYTDLNEPHQVSSSLLEEKQPRAQESIVSHLIELQKPILAQPRSCLSCSSL